MEKEIKTLANELIEVKQKMHYRAASGGALNPDAIK